MNHIKYAIIGLVTLCSSPIWVPPLIIYLIFKYFEYLGKEILGHNDEPIFKGARMSPTTTAPYIDVTKFKKINKK